MSFARILKQIQPQKAVTVAGVVMAAGLFAVPVAAQQSIALSGMFGNKPLLVIDGAPPKIVAVGQTHMGVKVLQASGDQAVVMSDGQRLTLRVGEAPVNMGSMMTAQPAVEAGGARGDNRRIVLSHTGGGHFVVNGAINGKTARFLVDTGATNVAMDVATAERIGINYKSGKPTRGYTANGIADGWSVKLNSVTLGGVTVHAVDATVLRSSMHGHILLGNSFLNRFTMTRNGDEMILVRRY